MGCLFYILTFKKMKNAVIESYRNRVADSKDIGQIHSAFWARALNRKMLSMVEGNVCVQKATASQQGRGKQLNSGSRCPSLCM